jgi:histidine triad (HIT) family protein
MDCIFCQIVAGEIPSERVHEDDQTLVFADIQPQAPTHLLVIPKRHVPSLDELDDPALGGALFSTARTVAARAGLEEGWRLIVNTGGHGGQEVDHLHLHVLGGRPLGRMLAAVGD